MSKQTFKEEHQEYVKQFTQDELYYYAVQWLNHVNLTKNIHKLWHEEDQEDEDTAEEKANQENITSSVEAE